MASSSPSSAFTAFFQSIVDATAATGGGCTASAIGEAVVVTTLVGLGLAVAVQLLSQVVFVALSGKVQTPASTCVFLVGKTLLFAVVVVGAETVHCAASAGLSVAAVFLFSIWNFLLVLVTQLQPVWNGVLWHMRWYLLQWRFVCASAAFTVLVCVHGSVGGGGSGGDCTSASAASGGSGNDVAFAENLHYMLTGEWAEFGMDAIDDATDAWFPRELFFEDAEAEQLHADTRRAEMWRILWEEPLDGEPPLNYVLRGHPDAAAVRQDVELAVSRRLQEGLNDQLGLAAALTQDNELLQDASRIVSAWVHTIGFTGNWLMFKAIRLVQIPQKLRWLYTELAEVFGVLVDALSDHFTELTEQLALLFEKLLKFFGTAVGCVGRLSKGEVGPACETMIPALMDLIETLLKVVLKLVLAAVSTLQRILVSLLPSWLGGTDGVAEDPGESFSEDEWTETAYGPRRGPGTVSASDGDARVLFEVRPDGLPEAPPAPPPPPPSRHLLDAHQRLLGQRPRRKMPWAAAPEHLARTAARFLRSGIPHAHGLFDDVEQRLVRTHGRDALVHTHDFSQVSHGWLEDVVVRFAAHPERATRRRLQATTGSECGVDEGYSFSTAPGCEDWEDHPLAHWTYAIRLLASDSGLQPPGCCLCGVDADAAFCGDAVHLPNDRSFFWADILDYVLVMMNPLCNWSGNIHRRCFPSIDFNFTEAAVTDGQIRLCLEHWRPAGASRGVLVNALRYDAAALLGSLWGGEGEGGTVFCLPFAAARLAVAALLVYLAMGCFGDVALLCLKLAENI